MKTTFDLHEDLVRAVKKLARERGTTARAIVGVGTAGPRPRLREVRRTEGPKHPEVTTLELGTVVSHRLT